MLNTAPTTPARPSSHATLKAYQDHHRPTRAAKSVRYMTKSKKDELQRHVQALHAKECVGNTAAIIGRAAWSRAHISSKFLQEEPALSASCWPEYLYLSPLERTRRFTTEYLRAYKHYANRMIDHRRVAHLCPVNEVFECNAAQGMSALWRARQCADELCMPYDKYLFPLFEHALEVEGHTRLPLPNQLYDLAQIEHVVEKWNEWTRDGITVTSNWDERLLAMNFRDTLAQRHCHDVLINLIGSSVGRLKQFMLRDGLLPESVARQRLGDDLVNRALDRHGPPRSSRLPAPSPGYLRPCIGLFANPGPACTGCPFTDPCKRISQAVDQEMKSVYRSTDPKADHVRELARRRQQKRRERIRKRDSELAFEDSHQGMEQGS